MNADVRDRAGGRPGARLRAFFALDETWRRPAPRVGRVDLVTGGVLAAAGVLTLELARSTGVHLGDAPLVVPFLLAAVAGLSLIWRRRHPVAVALFLAAHMFLTGITLPMVMAQLALQICYFAGLYNAMAWGRDRRTALLASSAIAGFMLLWVAWQFALGSGVQEIIDSQTSGDTAGIFPRVPSAVVLTFLLNVLYFVGALVIGQVAWRSARTQARLADQAVTIAAQAEELQRTAVVGERLRIARELHDVVGHHVSVIGVQAAGARRVMGHDPQTAAEALTVVEESSRQAVSQMRALLGTLRDLDSDDPDPADSDRADADPGDPTGDAGARLPEPGLADLPRLVDERTLGGVHTDLRVVADRPDALAAVPGALGLTLYRTAQEALANVTRHSTASNASVTVRISEGGPAAYVELEVLDDGRPRPGSMGSGLGQLGIRERVNSHRGSCEIGPRATGGYRVRVRLPLTTEAAR